MNDPQGIRFVNEVVRPLAEQLRANKVKLEAIKVEWENGVSDLFSKGGDIEDGREAEGVSRLTCDDVNNFMAQVLKIALGGAAALDEAIIAKPCVRALEVR